uniref:EF-hand domain-containing protein n=1 Tax=Glossina brevipalpis TaxID=37001 RepID=A0A1A9WMZ6_9MUSC
MMGSRDDYTSKEANLINQSKRELANGMDKDPVEKLRLMCYAKGAKGILGLARAFRNLDRNGDKRLHEEEFVNGIKQAGLPLNDDESKYMFRRFDEDNDGCVQMDEFLGKLRPTINKGRSDLIQRAFEKMDRSGDGIITANDLKTVYTVKYHPKYLSGELTEKEILGRFLEHFDTSCGIHDGKVTKEDFINYYATISASIDSDAYFDLIMRQSYKL